MKLPWGLTYLSRQRRMGPDLEHATPSALFPAQLVLYSDVDAAKDPVADRPS